MTHLNANAYMDKQYKTFNDKITNERQNQKLCTMLTNMPITNRMEMNDSIIPN